MSFDKLIIALKGSYRSGNFGHAGRPGNIGGSKPGGGHAAIGVTPLDNAAAIQRRAYIKRTDPKFKVTNYNDRQALEKHYDLYKKCISEHSLDCSAVKAYTNQAYENINGYLRGTGTSKYGKPPIEEVNDYINRMDEVFDKSPRTPEALKVFRGVNRDVLKDLEAGDVFRDDGFVSTSVDTDGAFAGARLEIRVPKGSRAVYVAQISDVGGEHELLLDRSSRFKVLDLKTSYSPTTGERVVQSAVMELIPEGEIA